MKKVMIFTGAGFSYPLGMPLTSGFEKLIASGDTSFNDLLKKFLGNNYSDVEHVLSTLESFINDKSFLESYLVQNDRTDTYFSTINIRKEERKKLAKAVIRNIKSGIFDILSEIDEVNCVDIYWGLLRELEENIRGDIAYSFFTTNYDLSFEEAIMYDPKLLSAFGINEVDFGFDITGGAQIFNPNKNYIWDVNKTEYKKLHGSIDWTLHRNKTCHKSGSANSPRDAEKMPLLFPGFKGVPRKDPFKSLHDQLLNRLSDADLVIAIGFAFRDPYINSVFNNGFMLNKKLKVLCYNPKDVVELPEESGIPELMEKYPDRFLYIKKGIVADNSPLDLENIRIHIHGDDTEVLDAKVKSVQDFFKQQMLKNAAQKDEH